MGVCFFRGMQRHGTNNQQSINQQFSDGNLGRKLLGKKHSWNGGQLGYLMGCESGKATPPPMLGRSSSISAKKVEGGIKADNETPTQLRTQPDAPYGTDFSVPSLSAWLVGMWLLRTGIARAGCSGWDEFGLACSYGVPHYQMYRTRT